MTDKRVWIVFSLLLLLILPIVISNNTVTATEDNKKGEAPISQPQTRLVVALSTEKHGSMTFTHVEGLGSVTNVIPHQEFEDESAPDGVVVPVKTVYKKTRLIRKLTTDETLAQWSQLVEEGELNQAKDNVSIAVSVGQDLIAEWKLKQAWPESIGVMMQDGTAYEVVDIVCEYLERVE